MDALLRDLLAYSGLTAAELTLAPVDLNALLTDIISQMQSEIQQGKAIISIEPTLDKVIGHAPTLRMFSAI